MDLSFFATPGFLLMALLVIFVVYSFARALYLEQRARSAARTAVVT
jgi:hypothetical protein